MEAKGSDGDGEMPALAEDEVVSGGKKNSHSHTHTSTQVHQCPSAPVQPPLQQYVCNLSAPTNLPQVSNDLVYPMLRDNPILTCRR